MESTIICPLCFSKKYEVVFSNKHIKDYKNHANDDHKISIISIQKPNFIYKCSNCNFLFSSRPDSEANIDKSYTNLIDEKYVEEENGRRRAANKILQKIEKYSNIGKILEIGCACGFLLDEARKKRWEVVGVELSKWACQYAQDNFKLNVINDKLENIELPEKQFDVVVLNDVIEHIYSPKELLLQIRKLLKDDGILYISTPNINSLISKLLRGKWWGINNLHLSYFTKKTLAKILKQCDFKIIKYTTHPRYFSIKYIKDCLFGNKFLRRLFFFLSDNSQIKINMYDQMDVIIKKNVKLQDISVTAKEGASLLSENAKVIAVLPAYNAEKTLEKTVDDISRDYVDEIILVDDNSIDKTVEVAKKLGLTVIKHKRNMGYGANQKTCYKAALEKGADIVVMVHPDYQYDPTVIPELIEPIKNGRADAVFGSRMMKGGALEGGMPLWKHNANILLTALENIILKTYLTEYHSGFRAYSANLLRRVNFEKNSDKFVFDTEMIVQTLVHNFKIEEVPIKTRYFDEASQIKFVPCLKYGFGIINTMLKYILHTKGVYKFKQFK